MLLSLFTLLYYVYVVFDFFTQMNLFIDPIDLQEEVDVEKPPREIPDPGSRYRYNLELLSPPVKRPSNIHVVEVIKRDEPTQEAQLQVQPDSSGQTTTTTAADQSSSPSTRISPTQRPIRPYLHQSQRKNVSFVDEAKKD